MTFKSVLFSVVFLAVSAFITTAADLKPNEELAFWKEKYPSENGVILNKIEQVEIKINKDGELDINSYSQFERILLNNKANMYSSASVYSDFFIETEVDKAYSLVPIDNKYKKYKVKEFTESDSYSSHVFYSDSKLKKFNFSGLVEGSKTYYSYNRKYLQPRFLGSFYFSTYLPVANSSYQIVCDANVQLKWKYFGLDTNKIQFTKTIKGSKVIYQWQMTDVEHYKSGNRGPDTRYYEPHLQLRIASYNYKGKKIPLLNDVEDLHNWYAELIEPVNKNISPEIKSIADSITNGLSSEMDKVQAIYYWVQDHIKYVAIENGLGGFVPREANLVCERRYGDCKDMSSMLFALMEAVDIQGHLTWIGSRDIPYSYADVPTPSADNHMICTYIDENNQPHFLDATGKFLPFNLPNSFIQGKEAIIHMPDGSYRLSKVPVTKMEDNVFADTSVLNINKDGTITGSGITTMNSYFQISMNNTLDALSAQKRNDYFQHLFIKGNNTAKTDVSKIINQGERDKPLSIKYDLSIKNYITISDNELFINPHLHKRFKDLSIDTKQEFFAVENRDKNIEKYQITLNIPDGYSVKYVPKPSAFKEQEFGFWVNYIQSSDGKSIVISYSVYHNYLLLPQDRFETYNKMTKELRRAFNESIILKKI